MDEAVSDETSTTQPTHVNSAGSVKETLESILVAFVLAFIFRAFVVEAFVIPTGSMAPTLMGAHMRFQCPDCGYRFDVNYTNTSPGANADGDDINIPSNAGLIRQPIYCPNCGFQMDSSQTGNPPVYSGDRILVLKYLYLFDEPKRWDVVVFKAPVQPQKFNYEQNYIKRLIGKPGEAVMVLDGDVYIRGKDAKDPADFVVQPKPKSAQDALWRLVYDNDYRPQMQMDRGEVPSFHLPWTQGGGSGWELNDSATHGRVFKFDNPAAAAPLNFNPTSNPTSQTLSDYLVYDVLPHDEIVKSPQDTYPNLRETPVSDLDLRVTYQRLSGEGPLTLLMTKRQDIFTAVITPTTAALFHEIGGKKVQIGETFALSKSSRPVRLELSNADYQVTLRVDETIAAQTTPKDYAPDIAKLLREYREEQLQFGGRDRTTAPPPTVQVIADRQTSQLSHVSLWRDVYYYNASQVTGIRVAMPADFPNHAQVLGPDEYFVMGDNSLVSYNAQYWTDPINLPGENLIVDAGKVPGRFLLGKAFFIYWPAGFKPLNSLPPVVPNFGDMRFIH